MMRRDRRFRRRRKEKPERPGPFGFFCCASFTGIFLLSSFRFFAEEKEAGRQQIRFSFYPELFYPQLYGSEKCHFRRRAQIAGIDIVGGKAGAEVSHATHGIASSAVSAAADSTVSAADAAVAAVTVIVTAAAGFIEIFRQEEANGMYQHIAACLRVMSRNRKHFHSSGMSIAVGADFCQHDGQCDPFVRADLPDPDA